MNSEEDSGPYKKALKAFLLPGLIVLQYQSIFDLVVSIMMLLFAPS